ncbi:hypothetical protein [Pseudodesulfovibrio portus]|uniref:Uncharacterized protein n=1 Tax=Pseudodesulfovibrio portus TaxID=231439 RepID=A0ABM8AVL2_9BACT|nr:hypothetical protein [Pseudodesulfovibrio portus]BDQ35595.1 hypothetical protein JCM14722_31370 [Pseudodesulfovibrio portus]
MFDYAHGSDSNGAFVSLNSYTAGETGFLDVPRPRKEFRQQKLGIYLLSDLFSASFMGKSHFVKDRQLVDLARDKRVSFTGETFDQWDLDVLLYCAMRTVTNRDSQGKIQVNPADVLRETGLRNFDENRDRVYASLFRLHTGSLLIEGKGYRYMTRLIDRVLLDQSKECCLVEVNGDVVNSLRNECNLRLAVESRFSMKRSGLAKWLHGAVLVFKGGFKADIGSLHSLCGASNRTRHLFPHMLGKALASLEEAGVITSWHIEGRKLMVLPGSRQMIETACGFIPSGTV